MNTEHLLFSLVPLRENAVLVLAYTIDCHLSPAAKILRIGFRAQPPLVVQLVDSLQKTVGKDCSAGLIADGYCGIVHFDMDQALGWRLPRKK